MNLLKAALYDPASAVSKSTASAIAITAFDTTNLRLAITVPAHGMVRFRLATVITGATTVPTIFLGVLNGATVVGRVNPQDFPGTMNAATQTSPAVADFVATGLTPGAMNCDAAYGVEVVVASTAIKYGGPNNTTTNDAWGAFQFEAWDPQPMPTAAPGAAGGLFIAGTNAATTITTGLTTTFTGNLTGSVASVTGAVGSVTAAVTLPSIPANWITAAGINASALNGKGDWMVSYTQPAGFLAATFPATVASTSNITTVGAVSGSVGSVTGAVGSVTGNVGGNVTGSVGSVTGNVGGNVVGSVASVTAAVTLPTIPSNWITAAGINAAALNGKGDWNIGKTGYSLTQTFPTNFASLAISAGGLASADIKSVNATAVNGSGTAGSPWGP